MPTRNIIIKSDLIPDCRFPIGISGLGSSLEGQAEEAAICILACGATNKTHPNARLDDQLNNGSTPHWQPSIETFLPSNGAIKRQSIRGFLFYVYVAVPSVRYV